MFSRGKNRGAHVLWPLGVKALYLRAVFEFCLDCGERREVAHGLLFVKLKNKEKTEYLSLFLL